MVRLSGAWPIPQPDSITLAGSVQRLCYRRTKEVLHDISYLKDESYQDPSCVRR